MQITSKESYTLDTSTITFRTGGEALPDESITFQVFPGSNRRPLANITVKNDKGSTSVISADLLTMIDELQEVAGGFWPVRQRIDKND